MNNNPELHSNTIRMYERFKNNEAFRKSMLILYIVFFIIYLIWRYTIINDESLLLSWTYYAADVLGFILGVNMIFASWNYNRREPKPSTGGKLIDVFIPTYKEPINVIRNTLKAALEITYPHKTIILDDGAREDVKKLALSLGAEYHSRPDHLNAKAGNLNYGFGKSNAEYVLVLDADHIAMPHIIDEMIGYFDDNEKIAMVQTPQDYYNTDAFQYMNAKNGALWHDQSFFYNLCLPSADHINAVSCVGTGVIYRRAALDDIGLIPTTSVTEDIHTSLKLHKKGYDTVYINEPLAYGIAAADIKEYYKTRHRWAHGNIHAILHENTLFSSELTWRQKLSYLSLSLIYLEGWQQLLFFLIPIGSLVFGLKPFDINIFNILVMLAFPFLSYALLQQAACGFGRFWANEIFSMVRWPIHILSCKAILKKKIPWETSSKNVKGEIHWRLMLPQISVMVLSISAVIYSIYKLSQDFEPGLLFRFFKQKFQTGIAFNENSISIFEAMPEGYSLDLLLIAGFWALYNATRAGFCITKAVSHAKLSKLNYGFEIPLFIYDEQNNHPIALTTHISETHMHFKLLHHNDICALGSNVNIKLPTGYSAVTIDTPIENNGVYETKIIPKSDTDFDQLWRCIYSIDWHREFVNRHSYFLTPIDFIIRILGFKNKNKLSSYKRIEPFLYSKDNNQSDDLSYGVALYYQQKNENTADIIVFENLENNSTLIQTNGSNREIQKTINIQHETPFMAIKANGLLKTAVTKYKVRIET